MALSRTTGTSQTRRPIRPLSDPLIDQIAAGEVVERPASVVKELVENALDAAARRIDVLLKEGGLKAITVIDDGFGIAPEELGLAVQRHATSKIALPADLEAIQTFGFRGEALASIAAVSEMTLKSRTESHDAGACVRISNGVAEGAPRPIALPVGTSITVEHLFEKIPARQKYLRSSATELAHCSRILKELALGAPHAHFYLTHQGRPICRFTASTPHARVLEVLKPNLPLQEISDRYSDSDVAFGYEAYLAWGPRARDQGALLLFINGRSVKNRNLIAAIRNPFIETFGSGQEPTGVFYLEVRHDWVDVNVHPQKLEVRCLRPERLYQWLVSSLRKQILAATPSPSSSSMKEATIASTPGLSEPPPIRMAPAPSPIPQPPAMRFRPRGEIAGFLLFEDEEGLLFVDPENFWEAHAFDLLVSEMAKGGLTAESLAIPLVLRPTPVALSRVTRHSGLLRRLGFEIEPFGDGDIAVKTRPRSVSEAAAESVLRALIEGDLEDESLALRTLARGISHSSFRSAFELTAVLNETARDKRLESALSPFGAPLFFLLPSSELRKHFKKEGSS